MCQEVRWDRGTDQDPAWSWDSGAGTWGPRDWGGREYEEKASAEEGEGLGGQTPLGSLRGGGLHGGGEGEDRGRGTCLGARAPASHQEPPLRVRQVQGQGGSQGHLGASAHRPVSPSAHAVLRRPERPWPLHPASVDCSCHPVRALEESRQTQEAQVWLPRPRDVPSPVGTLALNSLGCFQMTWGHRACPPATPAGGDILPLPEPLSPV